MELLIKNLLVFAVVMLSLNFAANAKYSFCSINDLQGHSIEKMTDVSNSPNSIELQNEFQGYVVGVSFMGLENEPFISVWPKGKNAIASAVGRELNIYIAKNNLIHVACD